MAITNATLRKRVAKGVELLDEKVPDWRDSIDTDRLNMRYGIYYSDPSNPTVSSRSKCGCVLAQTDSRDTGRGDFYRMLNLLHLSYDESAKYGFTFLLGEDSYWDKLTALWIEAINDV